MIQRIMRRLMRQSFLAWRATGKAPGWYYQAMDRWGHLASEDTPLVATLVNGCRMACRLSDHVERQIYFIGLYEPIEAFLLTRLLRPGMTVVDGGANVGQHTVMAAHAVSPGGVVHSFEPIPATFERLGHNVALNRFSNVRTTRSAMWSETTTVRLGLAEADNAGTFGVDIGGGISEVEANAICLDDYVEGLAIDRIDFVKLDVEGAELAALQGMRRVLERYRPTLLVEVCRATATRLGYEPQAIWELLVGELGYRAWAVGTWDEAAGAIDGLHDVTQQNVLFYDGDRIELPEMPRDLKTVLRWARSRETKGPT